MAYLTKDTIAIHQFKEIFQSNVHLPNKSTFSRKWSENSRYLATVKVKVSNFVHGLRLKPACRIPTGSRL